MFRFGSNHAWMLVLSLGLGLGAIACGDGSGSEGGSGGGGGSTATGGSGGSTATGGSGGSTATGGSGGSTCGTVAVPGKTIIGKVTYTGPVDPGDTLLVAAVKDGKPGIPAGFAKYADPVFPLDYEITGLPVDAATGVTTYGLVAFVDHGANNPTGPGAEDPQVLPPDLVDVTECEGASLDFEVPPDPPAP